MPSTKKEMNVKSKKNKTEMSNEEIYGENEFLAFVIDGEVVLTFMCDKRMSAILQSSPKVIEVSTTEDPFFYGPHIGWKYDGKSFISPNIDNTSNE